VTGKSPAFGRLLIFDDEPAVGVIIGAIAASIKFDSRSATNANDFFRLLRDWQPTHIALDLAMPNIDGIEAINMLGNLDCRAKIIITSGVGSRVLDAARRTAIEHGLSVAGVIAKPFPAAALRLLLTDDSAAATSRNTDDTQHASADSDAITRQDLVGALERREFRVFYQPKVYCGTGALDGFEALARWNRPKIGIITPDWFIPAVERAGLIDQLTDQVLDLGLAWLSSAFPKSNLSLSINLSSSSLDDIELANRISALCERHAIEPARVILEITESSAMTNPAAARELLTRLRLRGFRLSIDDFGVGYSSLIQLARLPFSELKIDRMFLSSAPESEESRNIVKAIIGLSHSLKLCVTAEGVEDEWTMGFLREAGCDLAQGYFISRPMDAEAALKWAQAQ
jgi:EAL domain-containing protein (putative c-di-GMP-specific phosphodiesterase class I)/ActR/RegA family two-component response regulator